MNNNDFGFNNFENNNFNGNNYSQFTPLTSNSNLNKKSKRRGGCLFAILKFFLFVLLLICIILGFLIYKGYREEQKELEDFKKEVLVEDYSGYIEEKINNMKSESSDINGMTKYDKVEKGLNPENGSDTDRDGLTDKEEIEIYGSDPLSPSTSGDGIPDGYKVQNNLDVLKKYDIKDIDYKGYNLYSNIEIKDKSSDNSLVSITEIEGYSVQGVKADKVYSIVDYNGVIELDFSDYIDNNSEYIIFKKNDESNSEYEILKDKNGVVSIDTKGLDCVIGIVKLSNFATNSLLESSFDFGISNNDMYFDDSIVILYPITLLTGQLKVQIFEKSLLGLGSDDGGTLSEELTKRVGLEDTDFSMNVEHYYLNPIQFAMFSKVLHYITSTGYITEALSSNNISVSNEDISMIQKVLYFFIMPLEVNAGDWDIFFVDKDEDISDVKAEKVSKYVSGFDVSKDALPFKNVGTYISKGGNCAGFAQITAQLFNENLYDAESEGTFKGKKYSYDITDMNYFSTFFDMYLYDYKNYSYWKDNYPNMDELSRDDYSEEDRNFLDFLGYKWAEANDINKKVLFFNSELPWSDFEKVISYFENNNKILSLGMSSGGSGHAINAYGVEQDKDNPNIWYLLIYDNNFPNNMYKDKVIDNRVKIVHKNPLFGEDYFEFDYQPLKEVPSYRFTSYLNGSWDAKLATVFQAHMFVMYDENLNILIGEEID